MPEIIIILDCSPVIEHSKILKCSPVIKHSFYVGTTCHLQIIVKSTCKTILQLDLAPMQ